MYPLLDDFQIKHAFDFYKDNPYFEKVSTLEEFKEKYLKRTIVSRPDLIDFHTKPYRTYILTSPVHEIGIDSVVNEKYIIHCKHCAYCEIRKHRGIFCEDDEIITLLCQNPHGMCSDRQVHEEDFCSRAVLRTQFLPHGKCDCRDLEVNVFVNNDNTFTYKLCCRFCNEDEVSVTGKFNEDEVSVTGKFNVDEALELLRDEWNQRSINSYKAKVRNSIRKR